MRQKQRPAAWSAIGLIVCAIIGGIAWTSGVSLVKLSDIFFMIGLALIVIGVVMQLSHAHLFAGFRRRRKQTYKEKADKEPESKMNTRDIAVKKNEPLRFSDWNRWLWIDGAILIIIAVVVTL
ncbi:DUF3899 domain-containing protein [Furfurilactobacillus milii]|uniref:DUF3899 domain-containing protein n=1 Tax=Furfurilactobacillus milii TaxID=2888272 RepID=A0A6N9I391_9LACO|nr:DUF3899 domain-containing protein [Furfurilactobacillus milii]MYV17309.1 DUF3899 domain-containing protein [Furfurilactobacillus milii]